MDVEVVWTIDSYTCSEFPYSVLEFRDISYSIYLSDAQMCATHALDGRCMSTVGGGPLR